VIEELLNRVIVAMVKAPEAQPEDDCPVYNPADLIV
jgi:hypothetical protein